MQFRVFSINFEDITGEKQNRVNKVTESLKADREKYNKLTKSHNKDISAKVSDKIDKSTGKEMREAASTFSHFVKGTTAVKAIGSIIRFKYYTDEIGVGMDYLYSSYHKRYSSAKIHPKFHEVFVLCVVSKSKGILFAPCKRAIKVNELLRNELKDLLKIKKVEEIRFEGKTFEKILDEVLSNNPENIVEEVKYIGATVKDEHLGKCYMSLDIQNKNSYKNYLDFKENYEEFILKLLVFTTKIHHVTDGKELTKTVKVCVQSNSKHPLSVSLKGGYSWYEPIFGWFGDILFKAQS